MAMYFTRHYDSPLGGITLASDGEALMGLWFDGRLTGYAGGICRKIRLIERELPILQKKL